MPKSIILLLSLVCCSISVTQAQKFKYKDIFPLLELKDYDTAIPQLETFFLDPKNADHANANLQMALYYEDQVNGLHMIDDSTAILKAAESTLVYLTKSKELISEKELKKNSEYYESYKRRDLRTGDFGIKISDVQLDVDNKIKSITGIIDNGSQIYSNLYATNQANKFCLETYKSFVEDYGTVNEFYLRCSEEQLGLLDKMIDIKEDIKDDFKEVRNGVAKIESKGYSPELEFKAISEFGIDGVQEVDFFVNDVIAWDYGQWAQLAYAKIDRDVRSIQEQLVTLDKKLKEEYESMSGLSTISYDDLTHEIDPKLIDELKQYDTDPIPLKLFSSMIKTNEYDFITKPLQNPRIKDVDDIDYQLLIADSLVSILEEIERDVKVLVEPAVTDAKFRYNPLVVGQYDGDFGLIKYRKKMEAFLGKSMDKWVKRKEEFRLESIWAINETQKDSIYLLSEFDSLYEAPMFDRYYTISTFQDDSLNIYAIGLEFTGSSDKGFVAAISNDRKVMWKVNFDLKGFSFGERERLVLGKLMSLQKGATTAYIYSMDPSAPQNLIALSFDNENGEIKWVSPNKVANKPVDVKFGELLKDTIFYIKTEEELKTATAEDVGYFVIDKDGKIR